MLTRGLTRKIDALGKVAIPAEWRREFGLEPGAQAEIYATDEGVFIRRKVKRVKAVQDEVRR